MIEKNLDSKKLLRAIELADKAIAISREKVKLVHELRRTLARQAVRQQILSPTLNHRQPCPVCKRIITFREVREGECHECRHRCPEVGRSKSPEAKWRL